MSYKPSVELLKMWKMTFLLNHPLSNSHPLSKSTLLPKLGELEYSKVLKDANGK